MESTQFFCDLLISKNWTWLSESCRFQGYKKFGPLSPELDFSQIFDNAWVTLICVDVWLGRPRSVRCKPIWIKAYHLNFIGCLFLRKIIIVRNNNVIYNKKSGFRIFGGLWNSLERPYNKKSIKFKPLFHNQAITTVWDRVCKNGIQKTAQNPSFSWIFCVFHEF